MPTVRLRPHYPGTNNPTQDHQSEHREDNMTTPPPERHPQVILQALERANRFVAAYRAGDNETAVQALHEANRDGRMMEFGLSCAIMLARQADVIHGDRAQLALDGLALDSAWFRDQELAILDERERDRNDDE